MFTVRRCFYSSPKGNSQMGRALENGERIVIKKSEPILIPPAEKTKDGLYFLSNFDQYQAFIQGSVYCFKSDTRSSDTACEVIKHSLAKVLVPYYPIAGRLAMSSDGKLVVDCTGEGVLFVEAVADYELQELGDATNPDPKIADLVHTLPGKKSILENPIMTVQVTKFKCGGWVLGVAINHCLVDGIAGTAFVYSWAEIARGLPITTPAFLDRSVLKSRQTLKIDFPHLEFLEIKNITKTISVSQDEILYRSFSFGRDRLSRLRRIAMDDGVIQKCTNFTVVAAHSWRVHTKALKMEPHQLTKLLLVVDFRSKFNPPLPKGFFGNAILHACCLCSAGELTSKPLSFAVKLVKEAIESVTEEYVRSAIDYYEVTRKNPVDTSTFILVSWTRLDFFNTDFGWGEPTQIGRTDPYQNAGIMLPHSKEKNGINLVLGMGAPVMNAFEELIQI